MSRRYSYNRSYNRSYSRTRNSYISRRGGYHGCYGYHGHYGIRSTEDVIVLFILAIVAMPIAGAYLLVSGKDSSRKTIGGILLVIGIILWVYLGIH